MITSVRNSQVRNARKLSKRGLRDKSRLFLVEGLRSISEAFAVGAQVESLFLESPRSDTLSNIATQAKRAKTEVLDVSVQVMRSISGATTPPGAIAVARFVDVQPAVLAARERSLGVVLAGVRDPGNLGTILRTAWAAGADSVFLSAGCVDAYNPKVVRAAAGALFNVPFARDVELPWLMREFKSKGIRTIAADTRGSTAYDELDLALPSALVFGGEASGIPEEVASEVSAMASIPMPGGAESLNVGIAAALFLFEAARQRRRT